MMVNFHSLVMIMCKINFLNFLKILNITLSYNINTNFKIKIDYDNV
jgi:hypothetical protein